MNTALQIQALEQLTRELLKTDPDSFLVEVKINQGNHVKIYVDADEGVSLERLVKYNRRFYKMIEEQHLFTNNDFSLEVSSPGLDEPLKMLRQYKKNIGRKVEVIQKDGIKKEGKLLNADESKIELAEEKGKFSVKNKAVKNMEMVNHIIPFENIKSTKIQISF